MHAPVGTGKVGHVAERLGPAQHKRVEQPHLDAGVLGQRRQLAVQSGGAAIVQQQAHTHAPVGSGNQGLQQQGAGLVTAPNVVLHVQAALGSVGQQHARGKGFQRVGQRVQAAAFGVCQQLRRHGLAQTGLDGFGSIKCP